MPAVAMSTRNVSAPSSVTVSIAFGIWIDMAKCKTHKPSDPHKLGITFTNKQIEYLQRIADEGLWGSTPTEVAYRLVIFSLGERFNF